MINSNLILLDPLHQFKITLLIGMPGSAFFVYFSFFLILGFYLFFQQAFGFSLIEGNSKINTYTFFFTALISFLKNNTKSHIQLDKQLFTVVFIDFSLGTFSLSFPHLFFSTKKKKFLSVGSFKRSLRKSLRLKKEKVDIEQRYWDWEIERYYYFKELNELQKNIFTVSKQFFEVVLMVHVIASIKVTKNKLK